MRTRVAIMLMSLRAFNALEFTVPMAAYGSSRQAKVPPARVRVPLGELGQIQVG